MYILCIVAIILFLFLFLPVEISSCTYIIVDNGDNSQNDCYRKGEGNKIKILLKIFKFIPVYSKTIDVSTKSDNGTIEFNIGTKNKDKKVQLSFNKIRKIIGAIIREEHGIQKIYRRIKEKIKNIKVKKLVFSFGFNTGDYLKNSYINASLNTLICMIINSKQERLNMNRLYYQIHVSNYNYYLVSDSIISLKIVNNIPIAISILRLINKMESRSDKDVRTSNRKFNGNSNGFA